MTAVAPDLPLNAETLAMLARLAKVMPAPFHTLGVAGSRQVIAALATPPVHDDVTAVTDTTSPGRGGPIPVRVYLPDVTAEAHPVIVYLHGGGWTLGSVDGVDAYCRRLSRLAAAAVVSVGYRLAPEHPYPAALHDCVDVYAWIDSAATPFPLDPQRVALAGDSAGGNLALAVSLARRDDGLVGPAALAVAYPAFDHADAARYPSCRRYAHAPILTAADVDWFFTNYLGDRAAHPDRWADPYAVPARAAHLRGLPATLIVTADCDPLRDCGIDLGRRLAADGIDVRHRNVLGAVHGFATEVGQLGAADTAVADVATFLGTVLRTASTPRL